MKHLSSDIQVGSNQDSRSGFNTFDGKEIPQENCRPSNSQGSEGQSLSEHLADMCGNQAVRFEYYYKRQMFKKGERRKIRVSLLHENYVKRFSLDDTFAFRFDTVLSHLCIMHRTYYDLRYGLKPGQLLPARHTDEAVKGGINFYGSLSSCRKSGDDVG